MPVARLAQTGAEDGVDSRYAWMRLAASVLLSTLGGVGLWSIVVALPAVQAEFGTARADAALPYTLTTLGFATGGILMGRLSDRFGVRVPVLHRHLRPRGRLRPCGAGDQHGAVRHHPWCADRAARQCATFGPLVADTSLWFERRRGFAVVAAPAATTSRARSGRPWCRPASPPLAGGRRMR